MIRYYKREGFMAVYKYDTDRERLQFYNHNHILDKSGWYYTEYSPSDIDKPEYGFVLIDEADAFLFLL